MSLRRLALAFFAGVTLAFACEVLLQFALSFVRASGMRSMADIALARVIARGPWLLVPLLVWMAAPMLAPALEGDVVFPGEAAVSAGGALRVVGIALVSLPLLWQLASMTFRLALIGVIGDWTVDGQVFLDPSFYSDLVITTSPWLLAGAALIAVARHQGN